MKNRYEFKLERYSSKHINNDANIISGFLLSGNTSFVNDVGFLAIFQRNNINID